MAKSRKQKPNRGAQIFVSLSLLFMIGLGLFVYFANLRQTAEKAAAPRPLTGFVQDSANLIDRDIRMGIEAKLRAFDALGGPQLVIATRYALDRPIEDEAIRLARAWKIGRAGADNGVLLLLIERDRKARIEVGYGLEGVLTDARTRIMIADSIEPAMARGDFTEAARSGMDAILAVLHPEPIRLPDVEQPGLGHALGVAFFMIIVVLICIGVIQAIVLSIPGMDRRIRSSSRFGWFARVRILGGSSGDRSSSSSGGSSSVGGGGNFGGGGSTG